MEWCQKMCLALRSQIQTQKTVYPFNQIVHFQILGNLFFKFSKFLFKIVLQIRLADLQVVSRFPQITTGLQVTVITSSG